MQKVTVYVGDTVRVFEVEVGMTPAVQVTQGVVQVKFRNRQHLDVDIITQDTVIIEETIV